MQLKEWAQTYLKNRDILQKNIIGFEEIEKDFIVHKTNGDTLFLIRPEITDANEITEKATASTGLVLLNTGKNLNFVISNWDKLSKLKGLCIYFVNTKTNEKWMLYPYTHEQITEKASLRRGLESVFAMTTPHSDHGNFEKQS